MMDGLALLIDVPEHTLDIKMHDMSLVDVEQVPPSVENGTSDDYVKRDMNPDPRQDPKARDLQRVGVRPPGAALPVEQTSSINSNDAVQDGTKPQKKVYVRTASGVGQYVLLDQLHAQKRRISQLKAPRAPKSFFQRINTKPVGRSAFRRNQRARAAARKEPSRLAAPPAVVFAFEKARDKHGNEFTYPDYWPPKEERELLSLMADMELERHPRERRTGGGGGHGGNPRKRRFREDDDERHDRGGGDYRGGHNRPQRKRHEEPIVAKLRRGYLNLADDGMLNPQVEASNLAKGIVANFEDAEVKGGVIDLAIQMCLEQPLKIPFVAATILYMNEGSADVAAEALARAGTVAQDAVNSGSWRTVKLMLRLFACLQGILEDEGIFPVLEQLFGAAVDLQTGSQEDSFGLELVKIILLTLPYAVAAAKGELNEKATEFLSNTGVIASAQHPLESLVEPYHGEDGTKPFGFQSVIGLLQKQLAIEAANGWELKLLPCPYKPTEPAKTADANGTQNGETNGDKKTDEAEAAAAEQPEPPKKHQLPLITIPSTPNPGPKPHFPETYFSLFADQAVKSVPPTDNLAACLVRDNMADTINIMDFNRNVTARLLVDLDNFWAPGTFARRATSFDKLGEMPEGQSTWKPEDMAVDAIFAQMVTLPTAEHKLVYYHSVITETCKIAPAAIAPSLGRAIRFMFKNMDVMDMELSYRFVDWFAHHLSNFEFRWKWIEWVDEVGKSNLHPKKAIIISALEKEIRLSFAKRIRETLPKEYHSLVGEGKEKDTPDFKYSNSNTPHAREGQEMLQLLRQRKPESDVQEFIDRINAAAAEQGATEPLVASTDAYMTCICFIGSKSLSHVLSCIERCKERLLGLESDAARAQIITSVVEYWKDQPGNAVNIVDKLLNYTIVSPEGVVSWALGQGQQGLGNGSGLADGWRYEMVARTVGKVTNRVRQIVAARVQAKTSNLPPDQIKMLEDTLHSERAAMRALFGLVEDVVGAVAAGASDALIEAEGEQLSEEDAALVRGWGEKWARVFRRKAAVEETVVSEMSVAIALAAAPEPAPPVVEEQQSTVDEAVANGQREQALGDAAAATATAMDVA